MVNNMDIKGKIHYRVSTCSPAELKSTLETAQIFYKYYATPAGKLLLLATERGIFKAQFIKTFYEIAENYIEKDFAHTDLLLSGTEFQLKVWQAALEIEPGTTITYHDLAEKIAHPTAYRAVANALGQNPVAYFVPCHRILRKGGALGGYKWGIERKVILLESERVKEEV